MRLLGRWTVLAAVSAATATASGDDALKRRGFFGAALVPSTTGAGVEVREVFAGSSADEAGVKPGDVLATVAGAPVQSPAEAVDAIGKARAGDALELGLVREGEPLDKTIKLKERPREQSDAFDVVYGSVPGKAGRLRTILTRPKGEAKRPALFLIQGYGCGSVEGMPGRPVEFQLIADAFTEHGFVTLRVEKPGCGDSEGGPCPEVDFLTELDGYRRGLKWLKTLDGVDPDKVFLFGHSLGGIWAPMVAADDPVKGVAVYGTVAKTWLEYELENRRRQLLLGGASYSEVDRRVRAGAEFLHALLVEKQEPGRIIAERPELADVGRVMSPDGRHVYGRSAEFLRQVAALPLTDAWSKLDARVLAAWGAADFVSTEADHRMIADLVNRDHPGRATFLTLVGIDHGFQRAGSPKESFDRSTSGAPREFHPGIIEALIDWADAVLAS